MIPKVENMTSPRSGAPVANQFVIKYSGGGALGNFKAVHVFQSYDSIIAEVTYWEDRTDVVLDTAYWNYSTTTSKYRNLFLGDTTAETKAKIKSGEYKVADLNK